MREVANSAKCEGTNKIQMAETEKGLIPIFFCDLNKLVKQLVYILKIMWCIEFQPHALTVH